MPHKRHRHQDVYLDGTLTYTNAIVLIDSRSETIRVKTENDIRAWVERLALSGASLAKVVGDMQHYTGVDADGTLRQIAFVKREADCGCGGRR